MTGCRYKKGFSAIGDRHLMITGDLSTELQFGNTVLFGPKLSNKYSFEIWDWEFNYLGIIAGADYIAWNNLQTFNHVLQPSLGIHYFYGMLELMYGYNFRLDDNPALPIDEHVIRLRLKPGILVQLLAQGWGQG